ncbi:Guanine nucleotide-binding protein-like 3-like protein, partial [Operophtera brumata]
TRCAQVEEAVRDAGKRLVIILNKADLVPRDNLTAWLKFLRRTAPAVPFKASTQDQQHNLGRKKMKHIVKEKEMKGSACVGAELLMSLLGNYCRNKGLKTSITVGVVGLPNIKILDSPGIVFHAGSESDSTVALKNAIRVGALKDPVTPAAAILQRANKHTLVELNSSHTWRRAWEEDGMQVDEDESSLLPKTLSIRSKLDKTKRAERTKQDPEMQIEGNTKQNKLRKIQFKKDKKNKARNEKTAVNLAGVLENII